MSSRNNNWATYLIALTLFLLEVSVDTAQIRVENKGAFIARVLIRYHDSKDQSQALNSGTFSSLKSAIINIEDNIQSIEIEVQMYTFINSVRTILKTSDPCPHTRCFVIWGTVFKAGWSESCCQ